MLSVWGGRGDAPAKIRAHTVESRVNFLNDSWRQFQQAHPQLLLDDHLPKRDEAFLVAMLNDVLAAQHDTVDASMSSIRDVFALEDTALVRDLCRRFGVEAMYNRSLERVFFEVLRLYENMIRAAVAAKGLRLPEQQWANDSPDCSSPLLLNMHRADPSVKRALDGFYEANAAFQYRGFCPREPFNRLRLLLALDITPLMQFVEVQLPSALKLNPDQPALKLQRPPLEMTGRQPHTQLLRGIRALMLLINTNLKEVLRYERYQLERAAELDRFCDAVAEAAAKLSK